ncbi:MAG: hypothetical protein KTR16_01195 [Acidiferrobacterales bacterium]|nr:hypothetical protein [Acidiferrobacterales bacterium]
MSDRMIRIAKLFCIFWIVLGSIGILKNGFVEFNKANLTGSLTIIMAFGAFFWFLNTPKKMFQDPKIFLTEIIGNKEEVLKGGWKYHEMIIDEGTELVQYFVAVSFIFGSIKVPTRFYVVDREDTFGMSAMYSLLTLLLGWWGLPWGPVYTIQSLSTNFKGGNLIKVKDLLV